MKRFAFILLFGPLFPAPAAAFTATTPPNAYMVENTSGTSPSGQVCYDFQTRPGCSAYIVGLSTNTPLPAGSTQYIQNTATPTTATQVFDVATGTIKSMIVKNSNPQTILSTSTVYPFAISVGGNAGVVVSTDSRLGIGGQPSLVNTAEMLHIENNTTPQASGVGNQKGGVDLVVNNSGTSGSRVITQSNFSVSTSTGIDSYMISFGSQDIGTYWPGGPQIANTNAMEYQNGKLTMFNFFGTLAAGGFQNTDAYFWNNTSTGTFHFNFGANGAGEMKISSSTLTFPDATAQTTAYPGSAGFILNQNTLQTGATFYTSSGTVNSMNIGTSLKFPDGSSETTAGWYVVRSTFTTSTSSTTSTTGATWFPTNVTLQITPKKTTDIVELKFAGLMLESGVTAFCDMNIFAGTGRQLIGTNGLTLNNTSATGTYMPYPLLTYDNPLITSATTYTVYFRNSGSSGTCALTPASYQSVFSAVINGN